MRDLGYRLLLLGLLSWLTSFALAQEMPPSQAVQGTWRVVFDDAPAGRFENTRLQIRPHEEDGDKLDVRLLYGTEPDSIRRTGYSTVTLEGNELSGRNGWYTDPRLFATLEGDRLVGRAEFPNDDETFFFEAERLDVTVTSVNVYRRYGYNDVSRGEIDGEVREFVQAPFYYDDLREAWKYAFSSDNLPRVRLEIHGENLPMHLYADRAYSSSDSMIFTHTGNWHGMEDGGLGVTLMIATDTEPGMKTAYLNEIPIEWELEIVKAKPKVESLRTRQRSGADYSSIDKPILPGTRVRLDLNFDRPLEEGPPLLTVAQPDAGEGEAQTIRLSTASYEGETWSDSFVVLPTELSGRWQPVASDDLVSGIFVEPGKTIEFSYEGNVVGSIDMRPIAEIDYVVAIDPQEGASNSSGDPYMRYPFAPGLTSAQRANDQRILLVVGRNLPTGIGDIYELDAYGQPIHYEAYRYDRHDSADDFDSRRMFDRGWEKLGKTISGLGNLPDREEAESMLVIASVEEGILPGFHELYLNGARAQWRLQFGDNTGDVRFLRDLDDGLFEPSDYLYFTERAAIELEPKIDVGLSSLDLVLRAYRKKEDGLKLYNGPVLLTANRTTGPDGEIVFRTQSIDLRPDNRGGRGRPVTPEVLQLTIEADTLLTATLVDPDLMMTPSVMPGADAAAEVYVTPSELNVLWADAMRSVAQCYDVAPDGGWDSIDSAQADEFMSINLNPLYLNNERNEVSEPLSVELGHLAGAEMLRRHYLESMEGAKRYWQQTLRDSQKRAQFANLLMSNELGIDDPLFKVEIQNPQGEKTTVHEMVLDDSVLMQRYGLPRSALDEWRSLQVDTVLLAVINSIDETLVYVAGLNKCEGDELVHAKDMLKLVGVAFDSIAADLNPRLVTLVERDNPRRLQWEPDVIARAWLQQAMAHGQTVMEIEARHTATIQLGLAAVSIVAGVGGPMIFAETNFAGLIGAELVSVAADVTMVAFDYSSNRERNAMLRRALGASRLLGNEVYTQAEEFGVSDEALGISVLASVGGISISTMSIRQIANTAQGLRAMAAARPMSAPAMSSLMATAQARRLSELGPAGQSAVLDVASHAVAKAANGGVDTLDEFEALGYGILERHVAEQGTESLEELTEATQRLGQSGDSDVVVAGGPMNDETEIVHFDWPQSVDEAAETVGPSGPLPDELPAQIEDLATTQADDIVVLNPGPAPDAGGSTTLQPPPTRPGDRMVPELADDLRRYNDMLQMQKDQRWIANQSEFNVRSSYLEEGAAEGTVNAENWAAVRTGAAWNVGGVPADAAMQVTGQTADELADALDRFLRDIYGFPNSGERASLIEAYMGDLTPQRYRDQAIYGWFDDPAPIQASRPGSRTPGTGLPPTGPLDPTDPLSLPTIPRPSSPQDAEGFDGYLTGLRAWADGAAEAGVRPPVDPDIVAGAQDGLRQLSTGRKSRARYVAYSAEFYGVELVDGIDAAAARILDQPGDMGQLISQADAMLYAIATRGKRPASLAEVMRSAQVRDQEIFDFLVGNVAAQTGARVENGQLIPSRIASGGGVPDETIVPIPGGDGGGSTIIEGPPPGSAGDSTLIEPPPGSVDDATIIDSNPGVPR